MINFTKIFCLTLLLPAVCFSDGHGHMGKDDYKNSNNLTDKSLIKEASIVEQLSPELRELLSKEMLALQGGMVSIIPDYISGNWKGVEKTAGKMKASYIFKQYLTKQQAKELHSVLPTTFIERDKNFHYLAGMLGHAANKKKPELVNFYYSEMLEACAGCHTKFAMHKFPNLISQKGNDHAH